MKTVRVSAIDAEGYSPEALLQEVEILAFEIHPKDLYNLEAIYLVNAVRVWVRMERVTMCYCRRRRHRNMARPKAMTKPKVPGSGIATK